MRSICFALLLLSTVTLAAAQPITGTYTLSGNSVELPLAHDGPSLFGMFPEGGFIESA